MAPKAEEPTTKTASAVSGRRWRRRRELGLYKSTTRVHKGFAEERNTPTSRGCRNGGTHSCVRVRLLSAVLAESAGRCKEEKGVKKGSYLVQPFSSESHRRRIGLVPIAGGPSLRGGNPFSTSSKAGAQRGIIPSKPPF